MSATKHTPGPWYAVGGWVEHGDDAVADICICYPDAMGQGHLGRSEDETRANAALIAAAPDLLKALKDIERQPGYGHMAQRRAAMAIAKAEGRA